MAQDAGVSTVSIVGADEDRELMRVRATVKLSGIKVGQVILVDPHDPYMAAALSAGRLVPAPEEAA